MDETNPPEFPPLVTEDTRSAEEVMWSLMPDWADTLMMQVQSRKFRQPVFWPANLTVEVEYDS